MTPEAAEQAVRFLQSASDDVTSVLDAVRDEAPEESPIYSSALAPAYAVIFRALALVDRLHPGLVPRGNPEAVSDADLAALERVAADDAASQQSWQHAATMTKDTGGRVAVTVLSVKRDLEAALPLMLTIETALRPEAMQREWRSAIEALDSVLSRLRAQLPDPSHSR